MMIKKLSIWILFGLLSWAVLLSVAALADFTVSKTMYESFSMINADGTPRTNCDLTKFTAETWLNDSRVALSWIFRNQSTGSYNAEATPSSAGDYKLAIFYNNTIVGTFTDMARLWDIDTYYASAGPRMGNLSTASARNATAIAGIPGGVWNNGVRTLTTPFVNSTGIDSYLSARHGSGVWGSGDPFAISTSVYNQLVVAHPNSITAAVVFANATSGVFVKEQVVNGDSVNVARNSTKTLIFYLGTQWNLAGKYVQVAARPNYLPSTPYRFNLPATVTDPVNGVCSVTLTSKETATVGTFYGEVGIWDNPALTGDKEVAETFKLVIQDSVFK